MKLMPSLAPFGRSRTRAQALLLVGALAWLPAPAAAQTLPERQSDKAVKALLEQIDEARDKFEGNLDGSLKNSTLRNETKEVSVSAFLQDLQDNTKKLKDRFNENYAASAEVEVVLKQGTAVDGFMQRSPNVSKGRSEWDHLAATLKSLAGIYGTTFPLPEGAAVRRMNDRETADAAGALADAANKFKDAVNQDKTLAKPDKESAKKTADGLNQAAKTLKSRLSDSKPATAELKSVVDMASQLAAFNTAHPLPLTAASSADIKAALGKIQQSFGMAAPH
jgi:hypothetical protein